VTFSPSQGEKLYSGIIMRSLSILGSLALTASATLVALPAAAQDGESVEIKGTCLYSDSLAPFVEQEHVFAVCDRVISRSVGARQEYLFAYPSRMRAIEFAGEFTDPKKLKVTEVRLSSSRAWVEANGTCTLKDRSDRPSSITCIVKVGQKFYVTNFEPSR
jgi:hypothetical protein